MLGSRILVADDKASSREFVRAILEPLGYIIEEAADGLAALEAIRSNPPDLVLLDLQMPVLSGQQVLAELRRENLFRRLPIVALTASAMAGDRERALSSGFTGYLSKPVQVSVLRAQVLSLLHPG